MNYSHKVLLGGYTVLTTVLGFRRGIHSYEYEVNKYNKKYKDQQKNFFYSESLLNGIMGSFFYFCPLTNIIMAKKEIYRAEVNLRNLESEKNTDYYNSLI